MNSRPVRALLAAAAALVALGGLAAPAARAQAVDKPAPPPTFRTRAEQVHVDVVVRDRRGEPVTGLRKEDFSVLEDGVVQSIDSFDAVDLPASPASGPSQALRRSISSNLDPGRPASAGRTLVFVFDDMHLSPLNGRRAQAALESFVNGAARDGDRVALAASSGLYWTARLPEGREDLLQLVRRLEGRRAPSATYDVVTDFEAMRVHLNNDTAVGDRVARRLRSYQMDFNRQHMALLSDKERLTRLPGINDPLVELRCAERYAEARRRNLLTINALRRALDATAPAPGRKALVLLSEGFVQDDSLDQHREVVEAARRANAAVYFVDVRGLEALPSFMSAESKLPIEDRDYGGTLANAAYDAEGASSLSESTGGFVVRHTNDVTGAVSRVMRDSRSYYVLGYSPTDAARDGRYRRIKVQVAREGLSVRGRRGYFAPREGAAARRTAETGTDPELEGALDSPVPLAGIPLRAGAYVLGALAGGRARGVLAVEIDINSLEFRRTAERLENALELVVVVVSRETGTALRHAKSLQMSLRHGTLETYRESWYAFDHELELAPGAYQARVIVRDAQRRVGSVIHEFEVPPLDALGTSSIVLTDVLDEGTGEAGTAVPVPVAHRTFRADKPLYLQFEVFGARNDGGSRKPRVSAGYEVLASDGTVARRGAARMITPTSLGALSRLVQWPANALRSGDYELVLEVWDAVSEQGTSVREKFTVSAGSEPGGSVTGGERGN